MKRASVGSLTIQLHFDARVHGVRLKVPMLGIDEHIPKTMRFDALPAGIFDATFTLYLAGGEQLRRAAKLKIESDRHNLAQFQFSQLPQELFVRPVDANDRTIFGAEVKVENVDLNFRPVRDWKGLSCQLPPGQYMVKVILPSMEVKTFPIQVGGNVREIKLPVEDASKKRREPRVYLALPVDYRTHEGFWISTESINISNSGACIVKRKPRPVETDIYVRLFVPLATGPVECPARVRWTRDIAPPQMGVELFLTNSMRLSLGSWLAATR